MALEVYRFAEPTRHRSDQIAARIILFHEQYLAVPRGLCPKCREKVLAVMEKRARNLAPVSAEGAIPYLGLLSWRFWRGRLSEIRLRLGLFRYSRLRDKCSDIRLGRWPGKCGGVRGAGRERVARRLTW